VKDRKYFTMRYTYDVVDDTSNAVLESGFSSEEEAYVYAQHFQIVHYTIVLREHPTVTGLGRDPDLH
jgi:type IV secretory pathway component VirB8